MLCHRILCALLVWWDLCFHQPVLHLSFVCSFLVDGLGFSECDLASSLYCTSGVDFTGSDGWTRTCRPCFTCLPLRFALGTVHGPSNCSPVEFSNGSSDFDAGPVFNIYALVSCNLSVVYEIVMLAKLQSLPYGCAWTFIFLLSFLAFWVAL